MKTILRSLAFLFVLVPVTLLADEAPGYADTPVIPNSAWRVHDQSRPQPVIVQPGTGDLGATPPSDAVVLFDGKSLEKWKGKNLNAVENGGFDIIKTGTLTTEEHFGSCQLHVEWTTSETKQDRMNWGNSGVFLLGSVEVQIIESHDSYIYADGNAGAIYGQYPPLVNPARKPGEWQSFDIFFTAPVIKDGVTNAPARITVLYNGVLVQNNVEILGTTLHKVSPGKITRQTGPIQLQDHHSSVKFRNIWLRKL